MIMRDQKEQNTKIVGKSKKSPRGVWNPSTNVNSKSNLSSLKSFFQKKFGSSKTKLEKDLNGPPKALNMTTFGVMGPPMTGRSDDIHINANQIDLGGPNTDRVVNHDTVLKTQGNED